MKREVYVMMDSISKNVGEPFTMSNHEEVRRAMMRMCGYTDIPNFAMRDMVVFHVGALVHDDGNVCVIPSPCPTIIARGENYCEKHDCEVPKEADSDSELHSA